jgi:hypothetical protein
MMHREIHASRRGLGGLIKEISTKMAEMHQYSKKLSR